MKKSLVMIIGILMFSLSLMILPSGVANAATFENGTYDVSFELKEAGNNNTSIADGYFSKPAKLVVKNGVNYIQLTTTESDWIKSISGPHGSATVINENGNSRTVQFEASDLSSLVNLKMHVVVPKEIAGMEYDNHHSVRADFNTNGIPTASKGNAVENTTPTSEVKENNEAIENPKTGDTSSIALYISLLIASIGLFSLYKTRLAKN